MYGLPKFSTAEVKQQILALVDAEISRNSDFSGDNLAVYGYEVEFSAKITLVQRSRPSTIEIEKTFSGGELSPVPDPDGTEQEPETVEVKASGRRRHGKPAQGS